MNHLLGLTITFMTLAVFYFHLSQAGAETTGKTDPIRLMPEILSFPDFGKAAGIFFLDQNLQKSKFIQDILSQQKYPPTIFKNKDKPKQKSFNREGKLLDLPIMEFKKINPTKYRIRIHNAHKSFPLIFSETFNQTWKVYLVASKNNFNGSSPNIDSAEEVLSSYKVFEGNEDFQASREELKSYLQGGLITHLGHREKEKSTLDFISKNFNRTIQNDNLSPGNIWDTWLPGKIRLACDPKEDNSNCQPAHPKAWSLQKGINSQAIQWPDLFHWQVNGYANSWWVDPSILQKLLPIKEGEARFYNINSDGSIDFEVIIEFWPQRLLYIGLAISGLSLFLCFTYLFFRFFKRLLRKKFHA